MLAWDRSDVGILCQTVTNIRTVPSQHHAFCSQSVSKHSTASYCGSPLQTVHNKCQLCGPVCYTEAELPNWMLSIVQLYHLMQISSWAILRTSTIAVSPVWPVPLMKRYKLLLDYYASLLFQNRCVHLCVSSDVSGRTGPHFFHVVTLLIGVFCAVVTRKGVLCS